MGTVADIEQKVRDRINASSETTFKETELMRYINDANRFVRRIIAADYPEYIAESITGSTVAGTALITLPASCLAIPDARVDNRPVPLVKRQSIYYLTDTGIPDRFYMQGDKSIYLWPVPDGVYSYNFLYVPVATSLTESSTTVWPLEIDDLLVELSVIRSQWKREYDMTAEASLVQEYRQQIFDLLGGMTGLPEPPKPYWG